MDKGQRIYKKYSGNLRFMYITGFLLYLVISLFLVSSLLYPLVIVVAVIMAYILRKLSNIKFRKHILGIILDDLDAPLYREVIKSSGIGAKNILWDIQSEFYAGNIRGAIDLCEASLNAGVIKKRELRTAMVFLAEFNCTIDDSEGLASACRRYRELGEPKLKTKQTKLTHVIIKKYECYLAGDYEGFLRPTGTKRKGAMYPIVASFDEAFIDMKKGDLSSAKAIFSALAVSAENTVFGMIAKRAVDAIDNGGTYRDAALIEFEPIDTEAVIKNHIEAIKKFKKPLRICFLLCGLVLIIWIPSTVRSYIFDVDEALTHAILEHVYDDVEIVDIVSFDVKGEKTGKIFIADTGDRLIIGEKYLNEAGEWMVVTYVRCSYSELEEQGSLIYVFNPRGVSEFLYFKVYDYFETSIEHDYSLCRGYYVNDHIITVIIDDNNIQ